MADRWLPDDQLIPAIRTGRCPRRYSDLSIPDRAWVIVGLFKARLTAEAIAELLGCSLRTVWVVKSDPLAEVLETYQQQMAAYRQETRMLRSELTRMTAERDTAAGAATRLRAHLVRVTAARDEAGVPVCTRGHALTPYNTYQHQGRRFCRECRRETQADYRQRRKHLSGVG